MEKTEIIYRKDMYIDVHIPTYMECTERKYSDFSKGTNILPWFYEIGYLDFLCYGQQSGER